MFTLRSRLRAAPRLNLATARAKAIPGDIRAIIKGTIELSMRIDNLSGLPARAPKRPSEGHLASGAPEPPETPRPDSAGHCGRRLGCH